MSPSAARSSPANPATPECEPTPSRRRPGTRQTEQGQIPNCALQVEQRSGRSTAALRAHPKLVAPQANQGRQGGCLQQPEAGKHRPGGQHDRSCRGFLASA